jgi:hypothetical protein
MQNIFTFYASTFTVDIFSPISACYTYLRIFYTLLALGVTLNALIIDLYVTI